MYLKSLEAANKLNTSCGTVLQRWRCVTFAKVCGNNSDTHSLSANLVVPVVQFLAIEYHLKR